jgi:peptidoglycan hydrolase-like protein with peptidoglycan-binding domain
VSTSTYDFVDLSHHNYDRGPIDWKAIASKYDGVILKRSQGTGFLDPAFEIMHRDARKHGLIVGAYHYQEFNTKGEAKKEADFFRRALRGFPVDFVAADIENPNTHGDITKPSIAFMKEIKKIAPALLYSYPYFIMAHFNKSIIKHSLWLASYRSTPQLVLWNDWAAWQNSATAHVNGLIGNVDTDLIKEEFLTKCQVNSKTKDKTSVSTPVDRKEHLLQSGDHGAKVKELQTHLVIINYAVGHIDGIFGPLTVAAVKRFQKAHNLVQDGIVGPKTRAAIEQALSYPGHIFQAKKPYPLEKKVGYVQRLGNLLGSALEVDNIYGPNTAKFVKKFQRKHHLKKDGIVGPKTWKAMFGE